MNDLLSLGHAAQSLGTMPAAIQRAVDKLGIQPELKLNGVPYFHELDLERVRIHLADRARSASRG